MKLARDEELEADYVISNYFPTEKEEYWWIIIGEKKTNKVLTTKRTLVKSSVDITMNFEKGESKKFILYALCDSYIDCDQA